MGSMFWGRLVTGLALCDRLIMWLAHPDTILEDIRGGLEKRGCNVKVGYRELVVWCGGCILKIDVWEEDTLKMMESLGTIAREAVGQGYRALGLEIRVSEACSWLCETVSLLLMRGGG